MRSRLEPGTLIGGRYRLDHPLGEGGMGAVWAATHTVTLRRHALKLLKSSALLLPEVRRRFVREARAASAVSHPNVVVVSDVFETDEGVPVMVMDLLVGETLGAHLRRRGSLPLEEVAALMLPVISAVGTAHATGVVHRDLKPDNIFLTSGDRSNVYVLDFGIAKWIGHDIVGTTAAVTRTGTLLGTPCYMSPEQGFGEKDIDHRTDLWSLGVILYECLAGARPVEGENLGQVLKRLMNEGITPIEAIVPVTDDIAKLVGRLLSRDRDDRPEDLREVFAVLSEHAPTSAPSFGPPRVDALDDGEHDAHAAIGTGPTQVLEQTAGPTSLSIAQFERRRLPYVVGGGLLMIALVAGIVLGRLRVGVADAGADMDVRPSAGATIAKEQIPKPRRTTTIAKPSTDSPEGTSAIPSATIAIPSATIAIPGASAAVSEPRTAPVRGSWRERPSPPPVPSEASAASSSPPLDPPAPKKRGLVEEPPF